MKTPRELLLNRHAPAKEKLDAIRQETIRAAAEMNRRTLSNRERTFPTAALHVLTISFRELIWRPRRIWAGFAAVWLAIVAVNLADADHSTSAAASAKPPPAGFFIGWEQQEKVLAELIGQAEPAPADRPKPAAPRPRSERQRAWAAT